MPLSRRPSVGLREADGGSLGRIQGDPHVSHVFCCNRCWRSHLLALEWSWPVFLFSLTPLAWSCVGHLHSVLCSFVRVAAGAALAVSAAAAAVDALATLLPCTALWKPLTHCRRVHCAARVLHVCQPARRPQPAARMNSAAPPPGAAAYAHRPARRPPAWQAAAAPLPNPRPVAHLSCPSCFALAPCKRQDCPQFCLPEPTLDPK